MLILVAVAMGLFVLMCSVVGLRLLWLAARTRKRPELLCGLGFSLIGLIGYPASLLSGKGAHTIGEMWLDAYVVGTVFTNAGVAAFYLFTASVFRPGVGWARAFTAVAIGALAFGAGGSIRAVAGADADRFAIEVTAAWNTLLQIASLGAFGWTSIEGFIQARKAQRRVELGLADRLTADRFRLWGVFGASTTVLTLVFVVSLQLGRSTTDDPVVHFASALLGGLSSVAMALAFFPPRAYVRWMQGAPSS